MLAKIILFLIILWVVLAIFFTYSYIIGWRISIYPNVLGFYKSVRDK
jgi:hypothetical protein